MQRSKQPLYSITSSARASSDSGAVRPIAFAALRLMWPTLYLRLHRQIGQAYRLEDANRWLVRPPHLVEPLLAPGNFSVKLISVAPY
jgi:hypothetical protein